MNLEGQADLVRFQSRQLKSGYEDKVVTIAMLRDRELALLLVCPVVLVQLKETTDDPI